MRSICVLFYTEISHLCVGSTFPTCIRITFLRIRNTFNTFSTDLGPGPRLGPEPVTGSRTWKWITLLRAIPTLLGSPWWAMSDLYLVMNFPVPTLPPTPTTKPSKKQTEKMMLRWFWRYFRAEISHADLAREQIWFW